MSRWWGGTRRSRPVLAGVIALVVVVAPETAGAATVLVGPVDDGAAEASCSKYAQCPPGLFFSARPGEKNVVTISRLTSGSVRIEDTGTALKAGTGCVRTDEHTAECTAGTPGRILHGGSIELADGNDAFTSLGDLFLGGEGLSGGDGNDTVTFANGGYVQGGPGNDVISCRALPTVPPASCTLHGGPGRDQLFGSAGNDILSGGQGTDALDGGAGADLLDYSDHRASLIVDLDATTQAAEVAGTVEPIGGFEAVRGGSGDDRLISPSGGKVPVGSLDFAMSGGAGNDRIQVRSGVTADGGEGDDRIVGVAQSQSRTLVGGRGDDRLTGGGGDDVLGGGSGDDTLDGRGGRDDVAGDTGDDVLKGGSQDDLLLGGNGSDRFFGGSGRDTVKAFENSKRQVRDRLDCGPGRRDRAFVERIDRVTRCERVKLSSDLPSPPS